MVQANSLSRGAYDMGKSKKTADDQTKGDRHRPRKMTAIQKPFIGPGERLAERLGMTFTQLVNQSLRKELELAGLWPPGHVGR